MNVRLPDGSQAVFEQIPESVARVFVLAGDDARALDFGRETPEAGVVVRREAFFHPVDA